MHTSKLTILQNLLFAALMAVVVAWAVPAEADLLVYTGGLNGQSSDPYPNSFPPLSYNGSIALTQFDPSLGTLNSITIDLSSVFIYGTQFENKSPNSGSTVTKNITQQLTIGSLLDTGLVAYNKTWTVSPYDGTVDYAGTSGFTVNESSGAKNVSSTLTGVNMSPYIGTGSMLFDVYSNASFSGGFTGGNGSFINSQNFATTVKVTYDYTPAVDPVPVGYNGQWLIITLVGLTLSGGCLLRKKITAD
jgi:hypothetical protein